MTTNLSNASDNENAIAYRWQVRVYYEDTDAGGVVYHSNYLNYMERARTECLRSTGFSQAMLDKELGVVFVVASVNINFLAPARFDDMLDVNSRILQVGGSKFEFEQSIINSAGNLLCTANINIVCVDSSTFRPKRIPEQIKAKLSYDN